jgi:F420H(2)-dependent quinone reductase
MYRSDRPNRVAAFLNRADRAIASAGLWPRRLVTLEVRGRRTGRLISLPVVVAEYQRERYLVAMLGERASWVSNVRAAGGQAVLRHGRREAVRLEEVDPGARAPIAAIPAGCTGSPRPRSRGSTRSARGVRTDCCALPSVPRHLVRGQA